MKFKTRHYVIAAASFLAAAMSPTYGQTVYQKTESFNTAASAAADGWWEFASRTNNHDFGYSDTSNAGGSPGEAGGKIAREPDLGFYGDVFSEPGQLTLTNPISASGKFEISVQMNNSDMRFGHFSYAVSRAQTSDVLIGWGMNEPNDASGAARLFLVTPNDNPRSDFRLFAGTNYTWTYTYLPPPAGTNGFGEVTMTWLGGAYNETLGTITTSNSFTVDLTSDPSSLSVNAFGIHAHSQGEDLAENGTYFWDDLDYTAVSNAVPFIPCVISYSGGLVVDLTATNAGSITVIVPTVANVSSDFNLAITSSDTSIANPTVSNVLFPAGGPNMAEIPISAGPGVGTATLSFSNTNGICGSPVNVTTLQPNNSKITKFESFDSAFSAALNGWQEMGSRSGGQNYGFSDTSNAGGSPGEAGGENKRARQRSAYGDVWSPDSGVLSLSDSLTVTGRIATLSGSGNPGIFIGYFNSARIGTSSAGDAVGLLLSSPSGTSARLDIRFEFADGSGLDALLGWATIEVGQTYGFDYHWDPTGGADGAGQMVMHLYDNSGGTLATGSYDLSAANRAKGAVLNAFGINSRSLSDRDNFSTNFVDDLSYTALSGGPCEITAAAVDSSMVIPSTRNAFAVTIPGWIDLNTPVTVDVISTNPAVAYPTGAPGGTLTVTFPAGRNYLTTNVPITAVALGTTAFYITNASAPTCISASHYESSVDVNCGAVTLSPASQSIYQAEGDRVVTVNLPPGLNDGGPITVTLETSDSGVAAPQTTSVQFVQGGPSSIDVPINAVSSGTATISIVDLTGGGCATFDSNNSCLVTVSCSPVTISPTTAVLLPGQNNQSLVVSFPASLNAADPVTMDLRSLNPAVAVPHGSSGGTLALAFPAGGANSQTVGIDAVGIGSTSFVLENVSATGCTDLSTNAVAQVSVMQPAITNTECQYFDSQASASGAGWTEVDSRGYGQDYGYSDSGNVSGNPGEAGGTFYRTNHLTMYADDSIGTLTLNDYISASGGLYISKPSTNNADVWLGFFNSVSTGTDTSSQPKSMFAVELSDNGDISNTRFRGIFGDSTGQNVAEVSANPTALLSYFTPYEWDFSYDPTAGPGGYGQMIWNITIFGLPYSITNNLTAANRANGAVFDRFGLVNMVRSTSASSDPIGLFVDDLCYTTGGNVTLQNIATLAGGQLLITFSSPAGSHKVQWTPSLSPASWSDVSGVNFVGPTGDNVWTAQFAVPAGNTGFFRVVANPSP